jgi:putative DNA primase/helicase
LSATPAYKAKDHPPMDLRTAEGMLSFISECEDREVWVAIGMALKSEFGDTAFSAWDSWSQQAGNYNALACRSSWRGFKARNGGYTIGTLIKLAKDGGYRFDASDRPQVDPADLARRRAERADRTAHELAQRQQAALNAEDVAKQYWHSAARTGESAYAVRKGIDAPESCRYLPTSGGGGLVIPMLRYDLDRSQALKGVQIIKDDGSKKFTFGMAKPGTACRLGLPVVGEPVFVCEGYATGMTLRMALERRYPVFVAFDAYNLPVVVEAVHRALPGSPIIICADDDHATTIKGLPNNVGRIQAQIAMEGVMDAGAKLVVRGFPVFRKETVRGDKDTDFNDLHRLEGLAEVTSQMELCLDTIQTLKTYG